MDDTKVLIATVQEGIDHVFADQNRSYTELFSDLARVVPRYRDKFLVDWTLFGYGVMSAKRSRSPNGFLRTILGYTILLEAGFDLSILLDSSKVYEKTNQERSKASFLDMYEKQILPFIRLLFSMWNAVGLVDYPITPPEVSRVPRKSPDEDDFGIGRLSLTGRPEKKGRFGVRRPSGRSRRRSRSQRRSRQRSRN